MPRRVVLVLALFLAARPALAADVSPVGDDPRVKQALRLLEARADGQQAYERLPGVSMAVVHDQSVLWSRGFGEAHLDRTAPATAETMYSICSISKLFTSVAVMQQRDAGKLRLDDPVAKHLPWFSIGRIPKGAEPITSCGTPHPLVRPPARDRHSLLDRARDTRSRRASKVLRAGPAAGDALPARDATSSTRTSASRSRARSPRRPSRQALRRATSRRTSSTRSGMTDTATEHPDG